MNRQPAVANRFYPGEDKPLRDEVEKYLPKGSSTAKKAIGVISPHAGYLYSGAVCGETLGSVEIPETVVILGPNHHGQGSPISLSTATWKMPMGDVLVNMEFIDFLTKASPVIEVDETAHKFEHSLEVQLPFLQTLQKNLTIVPLVIGHISYGMCSEIAKSLAETITQYKKPVLLLASSDMNHYETREMATRKDKLALEKITALDPEGLYRTVLDKRISMCGFMPTTIMLQASLLLGANLAEIIRYTDSGEVSGDTEQVVGYAGAVISIQ